MYGLYTIQVNFVTDGKLFFMKNTVVWKRLDLEHSIHKMLLLHVDLALKMFS